MATLASRTVSHLSRLAPCSATLQLVHTMTKLALLAAAAVILCGAPPAVVSSEAPTAPSREISFAQSPSDALLTARVDSLMSRLSAIGFNGMLEEVKPLLDFTPMSEAEKAHPMAWVFGSEGQYRCFADDPRRVRKPDVSVVLRERMPKRPRGVCTIAPDLVVEVVSPRDIAEDIIARLEDFRAAGTKLVWVVYPEQRRVFVHSPNATKEFGPDDVLDAEPVLHGFSVRVAELFE